eukprot:1512412-Rhodomonas_salina.1
MLQASWCPLRYTCTVFLPPCCSPQLGSSRTSQHLSRHCNQNGISQWGSLRNYCMCRLGSPGMEYCCTGFPNKACMHDRHCCQRYFCRL